MRELMTIRDASVWASARLGRNVTPSNITYLIQYGRIARAGDGALPMVCRRELEAYYADAVADKQRQWQRALGADLNWQLSFSQYKEAETTKHVHRLHPYKGKFIPQLAEYFLDSKTDAFKRAVFFRPGDIVLDPFCGSGTTLVQANELGLHAVGADVSAFNALMSNVKVDRYDTLELQRCAAEVTRQLSSFVQKRKNVLAFESELTEALKKFNAEFFPSPQFKFQVRRGQVDETVYGAEKERAFLKIYSRLLAAHKVTVRQKRGDSFLARWFVLPVREEIDFLAARIRQVPSEKIRRILLLILSRTVRSCRATTHADLGTLKEPVWTTYYCAKHGKMCRPLFSLFYWWRRYTQDTLKRLWQFEQLRSDTMQCCLAGDSRTLDMRKALRAGAPALAKLLKQQGAAGVFSSPPYVGLIDYHQQHAYAYDLFEFERRDELEIGPLCKGQGAAARRSYVCGVAEVLGNCRRFLKPDYNVFLVANDRHGLYPQIAEQAGMKIVKEYKRPVLNRTEKDRGAYAEIIFHLKEDSLCDSAIKN